MEKFIEISKDYWVSNLGRIKSKRNKKSPIFLKGGLDKDGYLHVSIDKKIRKIHRIVAMAFLPNPDNKPEVNHINGNKTDNRSDNLEWVTHKENFKHAIKHNLIKEGENHYKSKFTNKDVRDIFNLSKTMQGKDIAKIYNVSRSTISRILNGRRWKKTHKKIVEGKVR